jgi:succinate dehydrogenase hydrophobic anchor subunit
MRLYNPARSPVRIRVARQIRRSRSPYCDPVQTSGATMFNRIVKFLSLLVLFHHSRIALRATIGDALHLMALGMVALSVLFIVIYLSL